MALATSILFLTDVLGVIRTYLIPIAFAAAFAYFFFGIVKYIKGGGGVDDKGAGLQMMINGIIGLTVMFSVYALIGLVQSETGISATTTSITGLTF